MDFLDLAACSDALSCRSAFCSRMSGVLKKHSVVYSYTQTNHSDRALNSVANSSSTQPAAHWQQHTASSTPAAVSAGMNDSWSVGAEGTLALLQTFESRCALEWPDFSLRDCALRLHDYRQGMSKPVDKYVSCTSLRLWCHHSASPGARSSCDRYARLECRHAGSTQVEDTNDTGTHASSL